VPRSNLSPLRQPGPPYLRTLGERFVLTYSLRGNADIAFWIIRMSANETISDFDTLSVLHPKEKRRGGFKLGFGLAGPSVEYESP
jgi:hypothetical protein